MITAAATTAPQVGATPTSSTPTTRVRPSFQRRRSWRRVGTMTAIGPQGNAGRVVGVGFRWVGMAAFVATAAMAAFAALPRTSRPAPGRRMASRRVPSAVGCDLGWNIRRTSGRIDALRDGPAAGRDTGCGQGHGMTETRRAEGQPAALVTRASLAEGRSLADPLAQEVQLGATHLAVTQDFDLVDPRAVDLERALHADTGCDS